MADVEEFSPGGDVQLYISGLLYVQNQIFRWSHLNVLNFLFFSLPCPPAWAHVHCPCSGEPLRPPAWSQGQDVHLRDGRGGNLRICLLKSHSCLLSGDGRVAGDSQLFKARSNSPPPRGSRSISLLVFAGAPISYLHILISLSPKATISLVAILGLLVGTVYMAICLSYGINAMQPLSYSTSASSYGAATASSTPPFWSLSLSVGLSGSSSLYWPTYSWRAGGGGWRTSWSSWRSCRSLRRRWRRTTSPLFGSKTKMPQRVLRARRQHFSGVAGWLLFEDFRNWILNDMCNTHTLCIRIRTNTELSYYWYIYLTKCIKKTNTNYSAL